jgi:hypothetical protein
MRKSHWILQENTANRWNIEAVFRPEIIGKNLTNFRPEYCFNKITGISRNPRFPGWIVRPGLFILNLDVNTYICFFEYYQD